jgi:hypothetical protein
MTSNISPVKSNRISPFIANNLRRSAGVYRLDMTEIVLEKLGTTESVSLQLKREEGGKIPVASHLWEDAKVILKGEV